MKIRISAECSSHRASNDKKRTVVAKKKTVFAMPSRTTERRSTKVVQPNAYRSQVVTTWTTTHIMRSKCAVMWVNITTLLKINRWM